MGLEEKTGEVKTDILQGMKNKTMEEIINKWTGELDRCGEQFKIQANDIRRWDSILVENGDKVRHNYFFFFFFLTMDRLPNCIQRHWKQHKLKNELIQH